MVKNLKLTKSMKNESNWKKYTIKYSYEAKELLKRNLVKCYTYIKKRKNTKIDVNVSDIIEKCDKNEKINQEKKIYTQVAKLKVFHLWFLNYIQITSHYTQRILSIYIWWSNPWARRQDHVLYGHHDTLSPQYQSSPVYLPVASWFCCCYPCPNQS